MSRWPEAALGDLCDITIGKTPPRAERKYWGEGMPWLSIADMNQGRDLRGTKEQVTGLAADGPAGRLVQPGTLLLSFKLSVGKVGFSRVPMYTNEAIAALSIKDKSRTHPEFMYWALRCADLLRGADDAAMGKNLNKKKLAEFIVPLPPLAVQRRIAAVLDQVDVLRAKRREAITFLDDLAQSIFLDMFGDLPESARLADFSQVQGGLQLSSARNSKPQEVSYLRVANVYRGYLRLDEIKTLRATPEEIERTRLVKGDLLVVEGHGNPNEIGRTALWDGSIDVCTHQNHLIRIRVDHQYLVPEYVEMYLNSAVGRRHLLSSANTTSGLNTISTGAVKENPIAVPDMGRQRAFLSRLNRLQEVKQRHLTHLAILDELFTSLQHRAFSGILWDHEATGEAA